MNQEGWLGGQAVDLADGRPQRSNHVGVGVGLGHTIKKAPGGAKKFPWE
jgi:hypothetical protein